MLYSKFSNTTGTVFHTKKVFCRNWKLHCLRAAPLFLVTNYASVFILEVKQKIQAPFVLYRKLGMENCVKKVKKKSSYKTVIFRMLWVWSTIYNPLFSYVSSPQFIHYMQGTDSTHAAKFQFSTALQELAFPEQNKILISNFIHFACLHINTVCNVATWSTCRPALFFPISLQNHFQLSCDSL